ncbi:MAG: NAD-dependent dehydratase [Candidatus Firestonebacteria bacterium RIFOXYC2_FULL_39_67]|nr:MAG: NAD-dependent dehydratase [Candidatus Firestonebacteria bacterium RIFOXYD2_FULL_39_29]OGF52906.1 MAG: NAD-dependent dehydratase [Candidatus Firestonebacteria bacterium RifOxyC12_full_39_7]OGF55907.1 MAG: NAD-dependent dehydratase [Candidatus Firestonebacteria bacterium RIFOXYC2_FULL_39_67]
MSKKTALITGGAGFLGSHLCEYFINKGHLVICVDNLLTGSKDNIAHLDRKYLKFIKHDITKPLKIAGKVDYVLHFASPASPVDYTNHPIKTAKVGSLGTHNALGLAKAKKARFIVASTSEIYGDPHVHPQVEEYWGNVNSIGPRSMYDEAKRFSEALTMAYHRVHKIDTKIVRIFNTYGERMQINDGRVVPNFIYQALKGRDITVYGEGKQTRSFCYVSDLVDGIYKLLMSDYNLPVNIGNPTENTILDFAKTIIKMTGTKSKIIYKPIPVDDPKQRCPDITKARKLLHWEPKVDLEKGIARTIAYFRTKIK